MTRDDYRVAKRIIANVVIWHDADEPLDYNIGESIGLNAERVLEALTDAGFVFFRTSKRERSGESAV
jgi:hypothetical protein